MATKDNQKINPFLLLSQSYVGKFEEIYEGVDDPLGWEHDSNKIEQSKDCLYLNLICAVRHVVLGEYSHTANFSCVDKDMLTEREVWKNSLNLIVTMPFLTISYTLLMIS